MLAQATRIGPTQLAISALSRGSSVAYDSVNHVYLVVSSQGVLYGRFVGQDGVPLGTQFPIQGNPAIFAAFPRVAFSPHADAGAGAFLVTWDESYSPAPTQVHARLVSYPRGGAYGADTQLGSNCWFESGPNIAYATGSREFLIAWRDGATNDIDVVRVVNVDSVRGTLSPLPVAVVPFPHTPDGERDPSVAYSPDQDQFLVAYSGWNNASAFVAARRVKAGTGMVLDDVVLPNDNRIMLSQTGGTYITDATYNTTTGTYLVTWFALPESATMGRIVNTNGTAGAGPAALSTRWKAYDGLGVAYNARTNTSFVVSHSSASEDGGVEVLSTGLPFDNGFLVTQDGGNGNFYPRIAASVDGSDWLVSAANSFTSTVTQRLSGAPAAPPCSAPAVGPTSINVAGAGGTGSITLSGGTCSWSASPSVSWITVMSGGSGTGPGAVGLTITRNLTAWTRTGTVSVAGQTVTVTQGGSNVAAVAYDLNGDGLSDLLWQHQTTGELATWYLSANVMVGAYRLTISQVTDPGWKVVGTGDLDGDGLADIVWRHSSGYLAMWRMQGPQVLSTQMLNPSFVGDLNWKITAVGDVNGDGKADLIWRHEPDGNLAIWYMNGPNVIAGVMVNAPPVSDMNWKIVGAGDLNRDGTADLIWHNRATGALGAWTLIGNQVVVQQNLFFNGSPAGLSDLNWIAVGVGDVNGDGCADLIWQNTATGQLGVWYLNGFNIVGQFNIVNTAGAPVSVMDLNWKVVGPG